MVTKQLQLLQEISPVDDRLAVLAHASNPTALVAAESAARTLGLKYEVIDIEAPATISPAFERIQRSRATMVLIVSVRGELRRSHLQGRAARRPPSLLCGRRSGDRVARLAEPIVCLSASHL